MPPAPSGRMNSKRRPNAPENASGTAMDEWVRLAFVGLVMGSILHPGPDPSGGSRGELYRQQKYSYSRIPGFGYVPEEARHLRLAHTISTGLHAGCAP